MRKGPRKSEKEEKEEGGRRKEEEEEEEENTSLSKTPLSLSPSLCLDGQYYGAFEFSLQISS